MRPSCPILVRTVAASAVAFGALILVATPNLAEGAAGATNPSAQAEYQAVMKAIGHEGVHFSARASQNGVTVNVIGDTGATSGMQRMVIESGSLTERVSALVVGSTGYVSGNKDALHHVVGLPSSQSSKYAGKWLSFPTSNSGLDSLVSGLLNSQVSSEVAMTGPYHYGATAAVGGRTELTIHGYETSQGGGEVDTVLYVPSTGTPLPLQEVTNPGDAGGRSAIRGTVTFSHWGENTKEQAPAHSLSLLKLVPSSSGTATTTTKG